MARVLTVTAAMLIGLALWPALASETTVDVRDATETEIEWIREDLQRKLKDADSARFRGVKVKGAGQVCGFVNAKNSYGAYAGYTAFTGFIFDTISRALIQQVDDSKQTIALEMCRKEGLFP